MSVFDEMNGFNDHNYTNPDLKETLFPYIKRWKWFVLSIVFFSILGYAYLKLSTPLYKIETDLLIKDNKDKMGSGQTDLLKDLNVYSSDKIIDNEIQILRSRTLIKKVIKALKLQVSYVNVDDIRSQEVYNDKPFEVTLLTPYAKVYQTTLTIRLLDRNYVTVNGKKFPVNLPIQTEAGIILVKPEGAENSNQSLKVSFKSMFTLIEYYSNNLTIDPTSKQATVLVITLADAIPQRGIDFLNRLVEEYNKAALDDKNKESSRTLAFINDRLSGIATELSSVEKNVEEYKSKNRITDISSQAQIFLQSVQDNDAELNKILIQLSVLHNLEEYLNKTDNDANLPSMLGIDDPTLLGLVSQLGQAQLRKLSLLQTAPETNPAVETFNDQINALKKAISASVQNLKVGLQTTKQQLQANNSQFESVISQVPSKERGLLDVMRQQDIKNALFTYLLQKREETAMQLASGVADSRTIDPATSSGAPVKPVKNSIYLIFFAIGLILPAACIYLKELFNFKVKNKSDIERITRVPILAEVSHSTDNATLLAVSKPRSMVAEEIRSLRTNLDFVMSNKDQKVILFTSNISGEGKSFVSLNLGASLAMSNKKVVILELDLRKPKLHKELEIDGTQGLSTYLIDKAEYKDILKPIKLQKDYYIITCGPIPPNPAELLVNGKIQQLIEQLKKDFDYIIMDAPPIGLVTDAQILSVYADVTMFMVRHNYTAKSQISLLDDLYKNKKFPKLNIILNSVDHKNAYGYNYGYGRGGYYEEETEAKKFSLIKKRKN
jgi:tyrosine-protein kinase Etk/Wzc